MYLSKLTCYDDDYRTVHLDNKGKLKTTPYYPVQGDSTLKTMHWRHNSNTLAGAKRSSVNTAVGYLSEQDGHTCSSIQKQENIKSLDIIGHKLAKNISFPSFWKTGSIDLFANLLRFIIDPPITQAIHSQQYVLLLSRISFSTKTSLLVPKY